MTIIKRNGNGKKAKQLSAKEERDLCDAGRLCPNGEAWARRIGGSQSHYQFVELWWALKPEFRLTIPPDSDGATCKTCKRTLKIGKSNCGGNCDAIRACSCTACNVASFEANLRRSQPLRAIGLHSQSFIKKLNREWLLGSGRHNRSRDFRIEHIARVGCRLQAYDFLTFFLTFG